MILECTDCKHCADFIDGFRVYCLRPDLPPDEVYKYQPVGEGNAEDCKGFEDGASHWFNWEQVGEYEKYSEEKFGDITFEGIREWCLLQLKNGEENKR